MLHVQSAPLTRIVMPFDVLKDIGPGLCSGLIAVSSLTLMLQSSSVSGRGKAPIHHNKKRIVCWKMTLRKVCWYDLIARGRVG